ncbi:response regulator [Lewinella sp. IMCC34183]|uniref:response regulator n=1 Tax=Lewinella sp. IMCC34183 TaxID=2248762 RepID=UPI000E24D691|nr:response regulator [Lewinella sp. IMCC34183]
MATSTPPRSHESVAQRSPGDVQEGDYLLYAEDNPSDVIFFVRSLKKVDPNLRLEHRENGMLAREYLMDCVENNWALPNLVILDIKMPGLSGLDLLEYIRSTPELTQLPVIILSASAEERDKQRAYLNHVNAYLVKPDRYQDLSALVESIVSFWVWYNHVPV